MSAIGLDMMVVRSKVGPIHLRVTNPKVLLKDSKAERGDFCVAFLSPLGAERLCKEMGVSVITGAKLEHKLEAIEKGLTEEVPLVTAVAGVDKFEVRTDAHVLAAMVRVGVESIPVMVHVADVEGLRRLG